ncbi:MAG: hypothetical protein E7448_05725 [Ruminococcaceae bacterium]|nr:hypothetical protein [Oscillospiraceae bacterium]
MRVKKLYYISGTHWDREWYQTFQGFRFRLERALREMITYLENTPEFEVFYFDGQTIVFEDFLEVAPECEDRLKKLFQEGKIRIGPWYTMPDEFLVSGESIVRNLQKGHRICRDYGVESWKIGYVCDIFGHIAQLPQIFNGFDIHTAVLCRGTNEDTTSMFFNWKSPDGSTCTTYKLPSYLGYGSFGLEVTGTRAQRGQIEPDSTEFAEAAKAYIDREIARSNTDVAVLMDAADHEAIHPLTPLYIQKLRELYPDLEIVHGDFEECFLRAEQFDLPEKCGELIETSSYPAPYHNLLTNILSSRVDVKSRNDRCQHMLEQWMEPLVVYWQLNGIEVTKEYLNIAWKNLLQNHPHDSICGCSVDRVHDEMKFRFSQVESICEALTEEPLIVRRGAMSAIKANTDMVITLLYMGMDEGEHTVTVEIPFEKDYPSFHEGFGYETIHAFRLYDSEERELPYRIEKMVNDATMRTKSELVCNVDRYTVTFRTKLNAFGTTQIHIRPQNSPVRFAGRIADHEGNLENAYIRVEIEPDGRISLTNKKNGLVYRNLLGLLSDSEIGDGWWSVRNQCSQTSARTTLGAVQVLSNNGTGASVRIKRTLMVPACVNETAHGTVQSENLVPLQVEFTLTLNADEDFIRVNATVNNNAKDHRLRLHLPTDTASETYKVSQAFTFVERPVGVDDSQLWRKEPDQLEKNTDGIIMRTDLNGNGLAFVSAYGIHEAGADKDARASILVTLLRSFYRTHTKNNEEGGQIQGKHEFSFAIKPVQAESANQMLRFRESIREKVFSFAAQQEEIFQNGLLKVEGNVVVSAVKPLDDTQGVLLRVYNAEEDAQNVRVYVDAKWKTAYQLNLLEEKQEHLEIRGGYLSLSVPAHKILTIGLFESEEV